MSIPRPRRKTNDRKKKETIAFRRNFLPWDSMGLDKLVVAKFITFHPIVKYAPKRFRLCPQENYLTNSIE